MRILTISFLLTFISITINAQIWHTDFDETKKIATEQNRNIILVFQGSDWCTSCIKLDKQIWNTDEFKNYSKEHFVMLKADFPRRKANRLTKEQQQKNNLLAEKYNNEGSFPLVVILSHEGKVLGKTGYKNITPDEYIKLLISFK